LLLDPARKQQRRAIDAARPRRRDAPVVLNAQAAGCVLGVRVAGPASQAQHARDSLPGRVAIARTEPAEVLTSRALLVIVLANQPAAASPVFARYRPVPPEKLTAAARLDITAAPLSA